MRVLYVALTRAKERLIVTATIKESFDEFKSRLQSIGFTRQSILHERSYIEWIMSALLKSDEHAGCYDLNIHHSLENLLSDDGDFDAEKSEIVATSAEMSLAKAMLTANTVSKEEKSCGERRFRVLHRKFIHH